VKQEQSHDSSPENHFEFTWSLVLSFNKDLSDFTSSLQILNYVFDEKTSRARQNEACALSLSLSLHLSITLALSHPYNDRTETDTKTQNIPIRQSCM
jgi:hypothetical protein